jgi:hypothetical protein
MQEAVVGVRTPEFLLEKEQVNVETATREHDVTYPVVMDNSYRSDGHSRTNTPRHYPIDAKGQIHDQHFGEGDYGATSARFRNF